ncbi:MAG: hypothetical protein ACLRYF_04260 [Mediterraneibacter faecis]
MGLIDADNLLECVEVSMQNNTHRNGNAALCHVSEHRHFIETIVEQPTAFDVEKVIEQLNKELELADEEKRRCTIENMLQFDEAKGYARGMACAIEIVKRGGRDEE